MADLSYRYEQRPIRGGTDWGAVWAGVFAFLAVWSVFGALGLAIFATEANPNAAAPVTGMSTGMSFWVVILTTIAMFIAGRVTGHLGAMNSKRDGVMHGIIMFGLSVAGAIVLTSIAGATLSGGTGVNGSATAYTLNVVQTMGWAGFVALFLGWLAAMGGAYAGAPDNVVERPVAAPREIRPAA